MALTNVIVPCYNYGHFLPATLNSILAQTNPHWECIVVDDGSTDNTSDVVFSYRTRDARIRYVYQANRGLAEARNTGIRHLDPSGGYVQFLDADDLIEKRKLEVHAGFLDAHPDVGIVFGSAVHFDSKRAEEQKSPMHGERRSWSRDSLPGEVPPVKFFLRRNFPVSCPLLRASVLSAVGLFDPSINQVADWDYWLRCALHGITFQYVDNEDVRTLIRMHSTSMSANALHAKTEILLFRRKANVRLKGTAFCHLNWRQALDDEAYLGIEELKNGQPVRGSIRLLRVGALCPELSAKAKWILCLLASPFVDLQTLRNMPSTSIRNLTKRRTKATSSAAPLKA